MSDDIKKLLEQASFSFTGTILNLGAATMTNLAVDDRTAVVQVDHVLHAPDAFARIAGQRITIQLAADVDPPEVGQSFAFFAEGRAFGDSRGRRNRQATGRKRRASRQPGACFGRDGRRLYRTTSGNAPG